MLTFVSLTLAFCASLWQSQATPPPAAPPTQAARPADDAAEKMIDAKADAALRQMSDYLKGLSSFRFSTENESDQIASDGQKLRVLRNMTIEMKRPSKVRALSRGEGWEKEYWFDGKNCAVVDRRQRFYSIVDAPDSVDKMLDFMSERYGMSVPTADFLFPDVYATLTADVDSGRYVGRASVGSTPCHHLAFKQESVDWQLWVDVGDKPLPRKLVVTYKKQPGSPQFSATFVSWDTDARLSDAGFTFDPPAGFAKVELQPIEPSADAAPRKKDDPK